jgi:hypothetical protein
VYETPEFSAAPGNTYTLHITTAGGSEYTSREVRFKDGADLLDVYAKYIDGPTEDDKGIQVYLDTKDSTNQTQFYRWNYTETYEIHAPFPSVWVWVGNNDVVPRTESMDKCYVSDTLRNIMLHSTKDLEIDQVIGQKIRFIPAYSYIHRHRYSILVQQFCLSDESYAYWENLRMISEQQGSLSDVQPGSLSGNMISLGNASETVLFQKNGYFFQPLTSMMMA